MQPVSCAEASIAINERLMCHPGYELLDSNVPQPIALMIAVGHIGRSEHMGGL